MAMDTFSQQCLTNILTHATLQFINGYLRIIYKTTTLLYCGDDKLCFITEITFKESHEFALVTVVNRA